MFFSQVSQGSINSCGLAGSSRTRQQDHAAGFGEQLFETGQCIGFQAQIIQIETALVRIKIRITIFPPATQSPANYLAQPEKTTCAIRRHLRWCPSGRDPPEGDRTRN